MCVGEGSEYDTSPRQLLGAGGWVFAPAEKGRVVKVKTAGNTQQGQPGARSWQVFQEGSADQER